MHETIAERAASKTVLSGVIPPRPHATAYGRHDRYWIPLNHPNAMRFYTEHLFVPHSRQELLRGVMARALPQTSYAALRIRNGPETTLPASAVASPALMTLIEQAISDRLRKNPRFARGSPAPAIATGRPGRLEANTSLSTVKQLLPLASSPSLWALILGAYQNSGRGQNVLFLFDGASPYPCALAKVADGPGQQTQLQREHEALTSLQERLDPAMRSTIDRKSVV